PCLRSGRNRDRAGPEPLAAPLFAASDPVMPASVLPCPVLPCPAATPPRFDPFIPLRSITSSRYGQPPMMAAACSTFDRRQGEIPGHGDPPTSHPSSLAVPLRHSYSTIYYHFASGL